MARILIIEDDEVLAHLIKEWLVFEHHNVEMVHDGEQGRAILKLSHYDLIVLDWELPGIYGIDILKEYRTGGGTACVLFLSGRSALSDKESGLDCGADDYLTKPFQARELCARVRALLRRQEGQHSQVLRVGDLELDTSAYSVTKNGQDLKLLPKEFALLEFFMRHPRKVFTPDHLLSSVWAMDSEATVDAVTTCIKRLRRKIDQNGGSSLIQTVYGVGYKFQAPQC